MRNLAYLVYDVFTRSALAGNQLGVVPDASGLSGMQMQAIARELNLAETIFFLPPDKKEHSAKVRIFMPLGELPFAGHPTIGGAIAFAGLNGLAQWRRSDSRRGRRASALHGFSRILWVASHRLRSAHSQ